MDTLHKDYQEKKEAIVQQNIGGLKIPRDAQSHDWSNELNILSLSYYILYIVYEQIFFWIASQ